MKKKTSLVLVLAKIQLRECQSRSQGVDSSCDHPVQVGSVPATGKDCPCPEAPPSTPHTPGTRKSYLKAPGGHGSQGWEGPVVLSVPVLQWEHTGCSTQHSCFPQHSGSAQMCVLSPEVLPNGSQGSKNGVSPNLSRPTRSGVLCQGGFSLQMLPWGVGAQLTSLGELRTGLAGEHSFKSQLCSTGTKTRTKVAPEGQKWDKGWGLYLAFSLSPDRHRLVMESESQNTSPANKL